MCQMFGKCIVEIFLLEEQNNVGCQISLYNLNLNALEMKPHMGQFRQDGNLVHSVSTFEKF